MTQPLDRRAFLNSLGVTVGAAAATSAVPLVTPAAAQGVAPKGKIPDEFKGQVAEGNSVMYWTILDEKVIKQVKGSE